ncbi:MAG: NAD-binding protein [Ginsengibacter sp.]
MNRFSPFVGKLLILLLIMLTGTIGFILLEHYTVIDALYMTTITLATIGYNEVEPLSDAGKIFNIIFIISSFAVFAFIISSLTRDIVSGEMARHFKNRKFMHAINKFSGHVIICGFGRHGQQAAEVLAVNKIDFVAIDKDDVHMKNWLEEDKKVVYIHGDATDDETIMKAGIMKAKAVLLTLPADADNVFTVLSIRAMNPGIIIISRAQIKSSVGKLKTAGADHVILPESIGGSYMASMVSSPDVIELINSLWADQPESANIESVAYENLPAGVKDKSIQEIVLWVNTGVNCLGIKDKEGKYIVNPPQETIIGAEMKLIFFGSQQQILGLKKVVGAL